MLVDGGAKEILDVLIKMNSKDSSNLKFLDDVRSSGVLLCKRLNRLILLDDNPE